MIPFLPFAELKARVKFEHATYHYRALFDGAVIGETRVVPNMKREEQAFRERVYEVLLSHSATVLLRTACGCTQVVDLTAVCQLRSFKLMLALRNTSLPPECENEVDFGKWREFRWDGRSNCNGARYLDEVLE